VRCIITNNENKEQNHKLCQVNYEFPSNTNETANCEIPRRKMHVMEAIGIEMAEQNDRYNMVN